MLTQPELQDENIIACVQNAYGLSVSDLIFLPLGADRNTAVYRITAAGSKPYFLKLRSGAFDETSVALPKFLSNQGIRQVIPPLATAAGQLWATLDNYKVILYPFVTGRNGYEIKLSPRQWREFGRALRKIHDAAVPPALTGHIRCETFSPTGRATVKRFLQRPFLDHAGLDPRADAIAIQTARFLQARRDEILDLVSQAERLAGVLQAESPAPTVCHSDIHAGNLLIDEDDDLYIVDWDEPILAPKERDLMYAGAGLMGRWYAPQEEESLFFQGYGTTVVNLAALAYYRYERIVQDIAEFCKDIFATNGRVADREQGFYYLKSNFLPNHTIDIAYRSDKTLASHQSNRTGE